MDKFEQKLNKAKLGDRQAMQDLVLEYMPLIEGLVASANKNIDKDELKQHLMIKFIENTKKFKNFNLE